MIKYLAAACAFALMPIAVADAQQTLPRRSVLGASAANVEGGVQISQVRDDTPASRAGLAMGDVVTRIGDQTIANTRDFVTAARGASTSHATPFTITRAGAPRTLQVRLAEAPREQSPDLSITYESIRVGDTLRRTIVTTPRGARHRRPAMLLVGGIGCYSIDDANAPDPYRNVAHDIARRGLVVMRVEKSGMGDSQGAACATVDFEAEHAAYDAALAALRADRRVDPTQVFVFGHSIGVVHAPALAQRHRTAGVIAADGAGVTWMEYDLINTRRQIELSGASPAETDAILIAKAHCASRAFLAREPVEQLFTERPECAELVTLPASQAYMIQLTERNPGADWSAVSAPILFIYGDSDFLTSAADHERLLAVANAAHPGNATLSTIEDFDHYMVRTESQASSFARVGAGQAVAAYDPRFSQVVSDWICARAACAGVQTANR
ncbi:MAG: alpha/beta fold hydrolase [Hyphomonadaceae bacterium]|nr:alpha/beta fold hydrolase [Hyphomonadaceae bacterium]